MHPLHGTSTVQYTPDGGRSSSRFPDLGHSRQNFAEHDINMQLDRGFRAVFGCWLHVCSAAEVWIGVHEKSSLLAAELRKSHRCDA
eukprot:COSAG01_NODE_325_length_18790_cov_64.371101_16_plen_86_part_00